MLELDIFAAHCDLLNKRELEKVSLLAFYHYEWNNVGNFSLQDAVSWFEDLLLPKPNTSRLKSNIKKSCDFVKSSEKDYFRLSTKRLTKYKQAFSSLVEPAEDPKPIDSVLPLSLVEGSRGYIMKLSAQINVCYANSAFDGAAVLMRRLVEILLLHAYEHHKITVEIESSDGALKNLNSIITNAIQNQTINLSKPVKTCIDRFRVLGNFSAHSIHYNARRNDIKSVAIEFRVTVEELLYKAGIKQ